MIKAIETSYSGHRFRSRTEARWAIMFDELGIDWQYESEGFELSNGSRYLPDFLIDTKKERLSIIWVEVKAVAPTPDEIYKLLEVCKKPFRFGYFLCGQPGSHKIYKLFPEYEVDNCLDDLGNSNHQLACMLSNGKLDDRFLKRVEKAVSKSRAARFEFGEKP